MHVQKHLDCMSLVVLTPKQDRTLSTPEIYFAIYRSKKAHLHKSEL